MPYKKASVFEDPRLPVPLSDFTQSADKDCTRKGIAGLTFIQPCLYASTQGRLPEPVMAVKRLCNALFGRTGSQWLIVEVLGRKGDSTAVRTVTRRPLKDGQACDKPSNT